MSSSCLIPNVNIRSLVRMTAIGRNSTQEKELQLRVNLNQLCLGHDTADQSGSPTYFSMFHLTLALGTQGSAKTLN